MDATAFRTAELWDPDSGDFHRAGKTQHRRVNHTSTLLPDGRVAFIGGEAEIIVKETKQETVFRDITLDDVELWDPLNGKFRRAQSLTEPRREHTATLLQDGSILLVGGSRQQGDVPLDSAELWTPPRLDARIEPVVPDVILPVPQGISVAVAPPGEMTTRRYQHTATVLHDGRVLITGGTDGGPAELYDPASGMFSPTGSMSKSRETQTATRLADGSVLVVGEGSADIFDPDTGRFEPTGAPHDLVGILDSLLLDDGRVLVVQGSGAELYDPTTRAFEKLPNMTTIRMWTRLASLPDGRVLAVGVGPWRKARAEAEIFDPVTGTFNPVPLDRRLAEGHTLTAMPDGRVLLAGGWGSPAKSHLFDVERGFAPTKRLKLPRGAPEATALPDGRVLLFGGDFEGKDPRSIEAFDPETGTYTKVGRMKEERDGFTATLLQDGRVLIAGGGQVGEGGKPPRHAEIFDPETGRSTFTGVPAA